ncbi:MULTISPECIES: chromosome segregation protein SMC [Spirulina sp. CCY15215]|uniref:chromosome segregation protein SMC n=1 Tax=Spirulina sp. CCY15215 TaxID=2767591 RepID=UPI0019518336|nr:chromosome segregation protein SMC [Spirulina major]
MVHVKSVELSHFKSFGGTTNVPLLTGFTVISGPNGSGKSNILDALLFCLGLASSKGMRAERLPDLVNHNHLNQKGTSEVSVSVTFDLSDLEATGNREQAIVEEGTEEDNEFLENGTSPAPKSQPQTPDWKITRRLRVTKGGSYSSNYFINDEPCTAGDLHEQLRRLRIYPEGYNIVLQGDVTSIISMNSKERRQIIDELAGVAEFDRKIERVKSTLEEVKEKEERCQIIQQELTRSLEKLAGDRIKAEKYKKLKAQIQEQQQWEAIVLWRSLQQQEREVQDKIIAEDAELAKLAEKLEKLIAKIAEATKNLNDLNTRVKELGEDEQLSISSQLASQKLKRSQLQQRQQELNSLLQQAEATISRTTQEIEQFRNDFDRLSQEQSVLENETMEQLQTECDRDRNNLAAYKDQANELAAASDIWVQQQAALSKHIGSLQKLIDPQRTEQAQLQERQNQLEQKIAEQTQLLRSVEEELATQHENFSNFNDTAFAAQIQAIAQQLATAEEERNLAEETRNRLSNEQREKQRQLDKLEAKAQAQQEVQGTNATQIILKADIPGVCGLVAQLAQVEQQYKLALETAAGGRLANIVVEDDTVASMGIQLLKQKRGGRATFLPLNKMRKPNIPQSSPLNYAKGFIDFAFKLIDCDPKYKPIFAYVFGTTVVFATLEEARANLGKARIVTLEGELLESSGAMTGGSINARSSLHFGTAVPEKSQEINTLTNRLNEIEIILEKCEKLLSDKSETVKELSQKLTETRQQQREQNLRQEQAEKERDRLSKQKEQLTVQLTHNCQESGNAKIRLQELAKTLPELEQQLQGEQAKLAELEENQTSSEWQEIQTLIKDQEKELQAKEQAFRQAENQLLDLENQCLRLQEKVERSRAMLTVEQKKKIEAEQQQIKITQDLTKVEEKIQESEGLLQLLSSELMEAKRDRDRAEETLRSLQDSQQKTIWQQQKIQDSQQERQASLANLQQQRQEQELELPDPLPEVSDLVPSEGEKLTAETYTTHLEQLQKELRNAQRRLEAMEPVNMLALEEHERTNARLQELSEKLTTLEGERTELLLRIENFTTLRFRAFREAFDAVNENFQGIFASLSEGDGYLGLDDEEDPFSGGLNLIAHPKGKPVQRLSSMSGGEKSLTALSFIFALQRYRPSPFYAFDEVDMFLDGANVERLAKMIKRQAEQAQFIVVSLRRPMIESAQRTIGVTQARGAHTQVLGIKL